PGAARPVLLPLVADARSAGLGGRPGRRSGRSSPGGRAPAVLNHFRRAGQAVVGLGLSCQFCWLVLLRAFALASIVAGVVAGAFAHRPGLWFALLLVGGLLTFLAGVARDAKQTGKALRRAGRHPGGRGDNRDVAGLAPREPWLG